MDKSQADQTAERMLVPTLLPVNQLNKTYQHLVPVPLSLLKVAFQMTISSRAWQVYDAISA